MEHTFLQVIEKMQFMEANTPAGEEKEVRVDFEEEIVKPLCNSALFLDYTREIKDACKQIVDKNSRIVANAFSKPKSDYSFLYDKIQMVCGEDRMNLCDNDEVQVDLTSKCDMCLTIVQDIKNVLTRKKAADVYMTRKHIWSVLEDECQHIVFRFQGKVGRRLQNMCENLMDDHDEEMAEAFLEGNNLGKISVARMAQIFAESEKDSGVETILPGCRSQIQQERETICSRFVPEEFEIYSKKYIYFYRNLLGLLLSSKCKKFCPLSLKYSYYQEFQ